MLHHRVLIASAGSSGYTIDGSGLFDGAGRLDWTPSSVGDSRTTFSVHIILKRTTLDTQLFFFGAGNTVNPREGLNFLATNTLNVATNTGGAPVYDSTSDAVFRDVSAWQDILYVWDTTEAVEEDRMKFYINGTLITDTSTVTTSLNELSEFFNTVIGHTIGGVPGVSQFKGYIARIAFIDGQALDPTSFGEFDIYGNWQINNVKGLTFGTNGFLIEGGVDMAAGTDSSGNANNFTKTGTIIATADSPTDDVAVEAGNYATLNPNDRNTANTLSNGNLSVVGTTTTESRIRSTLTMPSGKWYWEVEVDTQNTSSQFVGISEVQAAITGNGNLGALATGYSIGCYNGPNNGVLYNNATGGTDLGTFSAGDIINVAFDADNRKLYFGQNGTWLGTADPAAGTGEHFTVTAGTYAPACNVYTTTGVLIFNFGAVATAYTPPSGFKTLNTANLPDPTIPDPTAHFQTALYTGNSSTNVITGLEFQPDLVWLKSRSLGAGGNPMLVDSLRGVGPTNQTKEIYPNLTNAEAATSAVTSFDPNGFTLSSPGTGDERFNQSSQTYVAWCFNLNGAGVSNTDGTITSTVSANTTAGMSAGTYTGNGTAGATFGHGLTEKPQLAFIKRRDATGNWLVYSETLGATKRLLLNTTAAAVTEAVFNNTEPTASVISLPDGTWTDVNASAGTYVFYAFHSVEGFSKIGSYTGNGSADGPFVNCGFRPAFVMIKRTDAIGVWLMQDTTREPFNGDNYATLAANSSSAEPQSGAGSFEGNFVDYLSNGFKLRSTAANSNASGGTYIYIAFAEMPVQAQSRAR